MKNHNQPPSPPQLPIIGNLHQLGKLPHRSLQKLSQKYGPIMLLQLGKVPTLVISSPEMAKQVLKTHDLECCSRPLTQGPRRLSYNFLDIAFSPYSDYWKEIRKICVLELFSSKRVKSFASVREESVASFIDLISQTSPNPVNLSEKMYYLLDCIICKIACGRSYQGKQFQNGSDSKLDKVIQEGIAMLGSFSAADFFPYVGWIVDVFTGLHARREKCFHQFDGFYQMVIDEHLNPHRPVPENEDTVDSLLRLLKNQSDEGLLTQDHIKAILKDLFLGAIDTTSDTLLWAMTELMKNPRVIKKLQAEIRSSVGNINKPLVEETVCENLKYLKMVFKETLRLHPPVVLMIPHLAQKHIQIGGYDVYPNTRIQVNVFAIGRDPEIWKNPEEFYPERFENEAIGIDFGGQYFELLPFGSGRRICPGIKLATAAFEFVLANLLYHFDWKLPDGMETEDLSMEEELGLTVHKKIPLCLVPIKYNP
ncbi:hypothetical protein EZV62_026192 [Acer yangbiense]|uniref:Cytochrome P450 n=1 Tax=Acer yangbiense TaxID=1000413 RepID=A0A5C7GQG9_9ROSI|nr:hypothetical protein EZV62_026192 [Acer yangbiense]